MHPTAHGTYPRVRSRHRSRAAGALMALTLLVVACVGEGTDGPTPALVTLRVEGSGAGQVAVDGTARSLPYELRALAGTTVELEALPAAGNLFVRWEDELNGTDNPATVTLSKTLEITAVFESEPAPDVEHRLQVVTAGDGAGHITSVPSGIDCGVGCEAPFAEGTSVELVAVADTGSFVVGWSGCDQVGGDICSLALDADRSATVTFARLDVTPANDDFADRVPLAGPQGAISASNAHASKEPGEPDHAGEPGGASLWWTWTPPVTGRATIGVGTSDVPAVVAVYRGTGLGDLTPVPPAAGASAIGATSLSFDVVADDATYVIAVDTAAGVNGLLRLTWSTVATVSWSADPSGLSFVGERGGSAPALQELTIANTGSGGSPFTATTDASSWSSVSPTSGSLGAGLESALAVTVTACTNVGTASGTVRIAGGGASTSVTITRTCEGASWTATPTSLVFVSLPGEPAPLVQSVTLRNGGNVTASYDILSDRDWLIVAPVAGTLTQGATSALDVSVTACGAFDALRTGVLTVTGGGHDTTLGVTHDCRVPPPVALAVDRVYVNQSVPAQDSAQAVSQLAIPLVAGRAGLLRVFATATGSGADQATATARYRIGTGPETTVPLTGPATVPTATDEGRLDTTYDVLLPASAIQPGVRLYVELSAVKDGITVTTRFPESGWWTPTTASMPLANFMLVPVTYAGWTPIVTGSAAADYLDMTSRMFPIGDRGVAVGSPYTFDGDLSGGQGGSPTSVGWATLLHQLDQRRISDGNGKHYVGIVNPQYGSGIAGVAYDNSKTYPMRPTAVAWSLHNASEVVAHELGHNWGRGHAPCNVSPSDPSYPYPGGITNTWGYDLGSGQLRPPSAYDIMSYCTNTWVSDYTYRNVLDFRSSSGFYITTSASTGTVLEVRGFVEHGSVTIDSVVRFDDWPLHAGEGPYRVVVEGLDGRELASGSFTPIETSFHDLAAFVVTLPLPGAENLRVGRIRITHQGVEVAERTPSIRPASAEPLRVVPLPDGSVRVTWDAGAYPNVLVRDGVDGSLLTDGRSGGVTVWPTGRVLQLLMSDGLNTEAVVIDF